MEVRKISFNTADKKYHGYIYKIYNTINDKIYIGQTRRDINIRWKQHLISAKSGRDGDTILYRAMNKYGVDKFYIEIVKEYSFETKEELITTLNKEEIRYISENNSAKPNGYNMQRGGKSPTESLKRPVDKYSLDGILLESYESLSAACSESDNLNHVHISECCRGILYTHGGYVWRYSGEKFNKFKQSDKRFRPVEQYSINGDFIKRYDSFADAVYENFNSRDHKKYSSHMVSCCKENRKSAYGYVWRYGDESSGI